APAPTPDQHRSAGASPIGSGQSTEALTQSSATSGVGPLAAVSPRGKAFVLGEPPTLLWTHRADVHLEPVPLLATTSVAFPGTGGKLFTLLRQEPQISITFQASAPFSTVPGHYGDIGYLPSTDLSLYALNLETGHVDWRF